MTKQILKNTPFALLDAVIPTNAQESSVFALPATASFIEVVAALSAAVATETVTCSIYGAEAVGGPFVLIDSALVPANATNITKNFAVFCAFTHIKVILSSVTRVSSTLTVTVNAKDVGGMGAGSGAFNGNFLPSLDDTYTLGDATHRWSKLYVAEKINLDTFSLSTYGGSDLDLFDDNGESDMYYDGQGLWNFNQTPGATNPTVVLINFEESSTGNFVCLGPNPNLLSSLGLVSSYFYNWNDAKSASGTSSLNLFRLSHTSTDLTATDGPINVLVSSEFGTGAVAAIGTLQGFSNQLNDSGSGDASNQTINGIWTHRIDIGTGYTQSTGPTTVAETIELNAFGPIGIQPSRFNNVNAVINNYYNGNPLTGKSAGLWIETNVNASDGNDAIHLAANTYAVNVGLGIQGTCTGGGVGFTTGILIGGNGGVWTAAGSSKIGTGIDIQDYTTRGLYIHAPSGSPTASIEADGLIIGDTFKPTTAYKSTDGSTGATTTITTASLVGKTATFKNGLLVSFA